LVTATIASVSRKGDSREAIASESVEVSVVMPCLNEAETLAACIAEAQEALENHDISGEIIIADNGSTDGSQEIAERMGARVVDVTRKGYGSALMGGIQQARGQYIVMGDADMSYDFGDIPKLVSPLRQGADIVMGNRFRGGIQPGAMPPLHRYLGNPVLTSIGRIFYKSPSSDFHCGLRAFTKSAYDRMDLRTTGMEFASEMVVKAAVLEMKLIEAPTKLRPDGRSRAPHLRSWRDGWRHLRFLLLYSPRWLFLYPGLLLMIAGIYLVFYIHKLITDPNGLLPLMCIGFVLGLVFLLWMMLPKGLRHMLSRVGRFIFRRNSKEAQHKH